MAEAPKPPAQPGTATSDALLEAALSAANAPDVSRLVLVTSRPDDDAAIRKLRRNGVPYVIVRPAPVADLEPEAMDVLRDRSVLIPAEVVETLKNTVPAGAVAWAVADAVEGESVGRTVEVAPSADTTLEQLLARAGARPKVVASWRSRVGRWFGQAIARIDGDHVVIDGAAAAA